MRIIIYLSLFLFTYSLFANPSSENEELNFQLFKAVKQENLAQVQEIIIQGANVNSQDIFEWTPLMFATYSQNIEMVKILIVSGAEVNASNQSDYGHI